MAANTAAAAITTTTRRSPRADRRADTPPARPPYEGTCPPGTQVRPVQVHDVHAGGVRGPAPPEVRRWSAQLGPNPAATEPHLHQWIGVCRTLPERATPRLGLWCQLYRRGRQPAARAAPPAKAAIVRWAAGRIRGVLVGPTAGNGLRLRKRHGRSRLGRRPWRYRKALGQQWPVLLRWLYRWRGRRTAGTSPLVGPMGPLRRAELFAHLLRLVTAFSVRWTWTGSAF